MYPSPLSTSLSSFNKQTRGERYHSTHSFKNKNLNCAPWEDPLAGKSTSCNRKVTSWTPPRVPAPDWKKSSPSEISRTLSIEIQKWVFLAGFGGQKTFFCVGGEKPCSACAASNPHIESPLEIPAGHFQTGCSANPPRGYFEILEQKPDPGGARNLGG